VARARCCQDGAARTSPGSTGPDCRLRSSPGSSRWTSGCSSGTRGRWRRPRLRVGTLPVSRARAGRLVPARRLPVARAAACTASARAARPYAAGMSYSACAAPRAARRSAPCSASRYSGPAPSVNSRSMRTTPAGATSSGPRSACTSTMSVHRAAHLARGGSRYGRGARTVAVHHSHDLLEGAGQHLAVAAARQLTPTQSQLPARMRVCA